MKLFAYKSLFLLQNSVCAKGVVFSGFNMTPAANWTKAANFIIKSKKHRGESIYANWNVYV